MILGIEGEDKCGKSTLAYTAPLPIVGFSFDLGSERAIYGTQFDQHFKGLKIEKIRFKRGDTAKKAWEGNDITIYELPQPIQLDSNKLIGFTDVWDYFIALVGMAAEDCMGVKLSTVVIDTMTLARRIKADAYLQELQENTPTSGKARKQLLQIEYGHANDSIRNIYTLFGGIGANLVALHHLTDERKDGLDRDGAVVSMLTGNRILEGLAQTYRYIDVGVRMDKVQGVPTGTLIRCGYNLSMEGDVITSPTWDKIVNRISMSVGDRLQFQRRNSEATGK